MIFIGCRWVPSVRRLMRAAVGAIGELGCASTTLFLLLGAPAAWANPTAPIVRAGQVTFARDGATLAIDQVTPHAIVNWASFGNQSGETIRINQPNATAAILNRVTGGDPTKILGDLTANGRVFVLNPNGVLVGAGARIDTNGFYASTHDLADAAFLAGADLTFSGDSRATIVNLGTITAQEGDIALIARTVENRGSLNAPRGAVALAAGTEVLLKASGNDRIYILAGGASDIAARGVENSGVVNAAQAELKAAGGNAYALAVNSGGSITATGIETRHGRIVLTAGGGDVAVSGNLTARNADGAGGEILVGGDFQGSNSAHVARAANTTITDTARLDASSLESPATNGGRIVVWSDGVTRFAGYLAATGASGGEAEVSGRTLALTGQADLRGTAGGPSGTLLLDPTDLTITNTATAYDAGAPGASTVGNAWINTQLASANVTLQATDTITGNADAPVAWSTANALTLRAGTSIVLNGAINASHAGSELAFENAAIVNAPAALTVGTVRYGGAGPKQAFNLANAANVFATLIVNDGEGSGYTQFEGTFNVVSNRSLSLGRATSVFRDAFHLQSAGAPVTIRANGDLTLAHGSTQFSGDLTYGSGDVTLRAVGGQFVNLAGSQAFDLNNPAARVLIYSTSPLTFNGTAFDDGGLTGFTQLRGIGSTSPLTPGTGHYFYFQNHLLTLTPLDAARTYGQTNPAFDYTVTGNTGSSTPTLTGLTLGTTATAASNAGTYAITAAGATAPDYDIAYGTGTLTVNRAPLTVSATATDRTYGGANGAFTATYAGLVNGDTGAAVVNPAISSTATTATGVGSATIAVSGPATTANYTVTYLDGTFAITPASLTVTANDAARDYGDANPAFTAFGAGYVNGQTDSLLTGVTFSTAATITSNVGTYTITPAGGSAPNYAITHYVPGTLTINPADLLIQLNGATRAYGASNPTFTGTVLNGLKNGDTFDFSSLNLTTTATAASGVGHYAITGVAGPVGNYQPILSGSAVLAITPASLTLVASDAARVWGDDNPAFGYTLTGMVNGDAAPTATGVSFTTAALRASNVGTYALTPAAGAATSNPNYLVGGFVPGTLTINPLLVIITADAFSRVYGDFNPVGFTGSYTSNSATAPAGTFGVGGASFADGSAQVRLGTTAGTTTGVGDYAFTFATSGAAAGNLVATLAPSSGKFTITPASLVVTPYLTLTAGTSAPLDYTASTRAAPITQVTADYKPTGTEYVVTTYKQEAANASGGVTYVKVVSTPLTANAITGTNPDGTVRMQVRNARYTSADGITYTRDATPHVDNSEGTITFNPNLARAITIVDPLPGVGLVATGLKNNDSLSVSYTRPGMPAANASYSLADLAINAGSNYAVTVNAADLSYRLAPLRLQLVLPDLSIPANFFLPDGAGETFNLTDDLTLADYTQIYLGQIQLLNAPSTEQFNEAAMALRVTRTQDGPATGAAPGITVTSDSVIVLSNNNVTVSTSGAAPTRPAVPGLGTTAIERIPGFTLGKRNFLADEINRIASLIKRGVPEQTGASPAELRNYYPVTPTISFNSPYLTGGVEYPLTYKAILPTGALIKTPKTWSNVIVSPALPPPLPPDSQNTAAGIAAAEAALAQIRADTFGNIEGRIAEINVGAPGKLEYALWRDFPDLFIPIPDRNANAFGLTAASDEFLGKALWLWAVSRDLPVGRGNASPADVAAWYKLAATNQEYKAEVAGFLAMLMSDVLARQAAAAHDPAKHPPLSSGDAAFLADFDAYISERQAIAFNRAAAAQESWINERFAVSLANVEGTRSSLLALTNTGHIGQQRPPPPEEFRKAAANWVPEVTPDDPAFQTVMRTLGYASDAPASGTGNDAGAMTTRSAISANASIGAADGFLQQGRQFVDDGVMEAIFAGLPKPAAVPQTSLGTKILEAVFPHTRSATLGTIASGVLMGASFVVEGLLGVLESDIQAAQFTRKMNDLRDKVSTDPKTALDILQTNPLVGRATDPRDTSARQAQNQLEARGYSDASMVTLMALFTTMVVGDPDQQISRVEQYNGPANGSRFNPQL